MKRFKIIGYNKIEVKTIVDAENEEEAMQIVNDREVSICVHGTDDSDATEYWVYVDAPDLNYEGCDIEELEIEEDEETN